MLLERGRGSLLAEKAEGAGFFNAGIAGIAEASFAWLAQIGWIRALGHEGGLFVTVGRRV